MKSGCGKGEIKCEATKGWFLFGRVASLFILLSDSQTALPTFRVYQVQLAVQVNRSEKQLPITYEAKRNAGLSSDVFSAAVLVFD